MGDCLRPNLGNTPATGGLHYEVFCAWKLALAEVKPSFKAPPQFKAPPSFKAPPPHLAIDSRWLPTAPYLGHRRGVIVHEFWRWRGG